ncbi:MAG TPA: exo-beta-N-acetylmuramidase NamZ domain-containing protein [Bryobacteraceae bacterium]|nr:exo-beta-N-acetylmuramidase NamZ domain-containing protein [Bryobacteraceae bacterium]
MWKWVVLAAVASVLAAQERFAGSDELDRLIQEAVDTDQMPGAVAWIGRGSTILHRKAYGNRSLVPAREPMTMDTVFDAASLTKVVATTASMMKLVEQGKVRLGDKVTVYLPEFQRGKSDITVRMLLTHFSGLRPDVDLVPEWNGYQTGIQKALIDKPVAGPGERFIYSDINFILLGEIVHQLTGKPLDQYAREEVFLPLGMTESQFNPPAALRPRIAPTEIYPKMAAPLRGVVHDPTTRFMNGVAGHAGLFTTASDLSRFARMLLGNGMLEEKRFVSPLTIQKFTQPQTPADQPILRGLGFDIDSPFSANRGELYPLGSFGHTGFTGTSLWVDPGTGSYVILLTNSVHPKRRPPVTGLRAKVATITAASLGVEIPGAILNGYNESLGGIRRTVARVGMVETGLDVLVTEKFKRLQGKRVGLVTNHTGFTRDGKRNIDAMVAAGVKLVAIYAPEHGIFGKEDHEGISDTIDPVTKIKIWSLYKDANRKPSPAMLAGVDVVVFDIQDVGARFYTYVSTMRNVLEETGKRGIPLMVLDRPNPITGARVEGPVLVHGSETFVGIHTIALRHGMTAGELAKLFLAEFSLKGPLEVVPMRGWQRGDWWDSTNLAWVDLSPNMRSLNAATIYTGVGMLEASKNYSVGRGTDSPFEQIGAAFIDGPKLAAYLNSRKIPGIRVYPTRFTPKESNLKGQLIGGVRFVITDREALSTSRLGLEIAAAIHKLFPGKLDFQINKGLIGNPETIRMILAGDDPRSILDQQASELDAFLARRAKYLIYK